MNQAWTPMRCDKASAAAVRSIMWPLVVRAPPFFLFFSMSGWMITATSAAAGKSALFSLIRPLNSGK